MIDFAPASLASSHGQIIYEAVFECSRCGAIVVDCPLHESWHEHLESS